MSHPKSDAGATGTRDVHPDSAEPVIESDEEPAAKPETTQPSDGQPPSAQESQKETVPCDPAAKFWPGIDCSKPRAEVDKAITECMRMKYGVTLVEDMKGAQLLLSYISRNGLQDETDVKDDTIKTLIAAAHRLRTSEFDCEKEEAQFRKDYGLIAKAANPVTVASLIDSLPTEPPRRRWTGRMEPECRSTAERACYRFRDLAIFVLVLLLLFQIYWTISSSVLSKTEELIKAIGDAPSNEWYLAQRATQLSAKKPANPQDAAESAPSKPATSQAIPSPTSPPQTTPNEPKGNKTQLTLVELVLKRAQLRANSTMLSKLMTPVAWLFFPKESYAVTSPLSVEQKKSQEEKKVSNKAELSADKSGAPPPPPSKDKSIEQNDVDPKDPEDIFTPTDIQTQSATTCAVAGQVISIMQKWLLPLLYGALGALVFVMRTLSLQAQERLFRREAVVSLILRVFLGMVSGLAIGWFWSQNQPTSTTDGPMSLTTLSPFALAFLAGYGVELFFALLDKIISTFTNKP